MKDTISSLKIDNLHVIAPVEASVSMNADNPTYSSGVKNKVFLTYNGAQAVGKNHGNYVEYPDFSFTGN